MATINITTTPAQDAVIQRVLDPANADRAAQTPPLVALSIPQYIMSILVSAFRGWKTKHAVEDTNALQTAWEAATPGQRTAARNALGL